MKNEELQNRQSQYLNEERRMKNEELAAPINMEEKKNRRTKNSSFFISSQAHQLCGLRSSFLVLMFMIETVAFAQHFTAKAPSTVVVGDQFRLTFTVNTQDVDNFQQPNIPDDIEVLMGPSVSTQSSFQMMNGHTSSSSSTTYTYICCATKPGIFTISGARVKAGGKTVAANVLTIKANAGSGNTRHSQGGGNQQQRGEEMRAAGSAITSSDLFIKVSANKTHVHEQEPILLTYKVYTLVDLTQLAGKMPDLKGFHTQEIQLPQQKSFSVERVNGRPYRTVTWSQYVMFPQMTGKLEIPSITFEGVVVQQNRNVDPFEAFFNGGSGYVEVKKKIKAPGLTVTVDPLPQRPTNFSGGVGKFSITAKPNKIAVNANSPVTLRVTVSGVGNMKLLKQPEVNFPKDFDVYDAKVTDKSKLTSRGVEGAMIYDFLAVPRHQGKYEIPPVTFVYYDVDENKYKELKSEGFTLDVAKGSGPASVNDYSQEELNTLNNDIRFIKLGNSELRPVGDHFFGSTGYWISLVALVVAFITLFVVFRKRAMDNANISKMRGKKANKVATKRLKKARTLMFTRDTANFYDEVLRALWGYVGDKLNMNVEQLSRDNISEKLQQRGVGEDTIKRFIEALDECEFERYAPGDSNGNMSKTFEAAMTAITTIENTMGKK